MKNLEEAKTQEAKSEYELLKTNCPFPCTKDHCPRSAVKMPQNGRWYITMGHAGFNSRANNRDGYATKARAMKANAFYHNRTEREAAGKGVQS